MEVEEMKNLKKHWKIYLHVNKVNNKKYVGITYRSVSKRLVEHSRSSSKFGNALRKYGIKSFKTEILAICFDLEYALIIESQFISYFNTINSGYNLSESGKSGNYGWKGSTQFKKSRSDYMKLNNPMFREETKSKLQKFHLGRKRSQSTKDKISKAIKTTKRKTKAFITPWGTFRTCDDASKYSNLSKSTIRRYCDSSDNIINNKVISHSTYLTQDMLGKTFKDIGFGRET